MEKTMKADKEEFEKANRLRAVSLLKTIKEIGLPTVTIQSNPVKRLAESYLEVTDELWVLRREEEIQRKCHETAQAEKQPLLIENHHLKSEVSMLNELIRTGKAERPIDLIECLKRENNVLRRKVEQLENEGKGQG
jgi:predicted nuclease with TOPRIM domain